MEPYVGQIAVGSSCDSVWKSVANIVVEMKSIVNLTIHLEKSSRSLPSSMCWSRISVNSAVFLWISGRVLTRFVLEKAGDKFFLAQSQLQLFDKINGNSRWLGMSRIYTHPSPCVCLENMLGVSRVTLLIFLRSLRFSPGDNALSPSKINLARAESHITKWCVKLISSGSRKTRPSSATVLKMYRCKLPSARHLLTPL